jgi:transglutaminase-like putative cysteine protease
VAPSAASPVQVDSVQPLAQRPDGTLVTPTDPLSSGSTYTVQSRQIPTTREQLAATDRDDVPDALVDRYASAPIASERTRDLVDQVTAGLTNDYDKVRAFERWMDANTTYSLDAPLAPKDVDVVDHFLFESRQGWCEQIASSLVVMSRLAGVPARLATGFTPGEWDAVGGRFVVRERDAHAWAEVWFPEFGWVTFDPTADVPLAGTAEATPGAAAVDWREVVGVVLALIGLVALGHGPLLRRWRLRRDRRAEQRRHRELVASRWDVAEEARLEQLGREAGRPRRPDETLTSYTTVLAGVVGDAQVTDRGVAIDRYRYGPEGGPIDPHGHPAADWSTVSTAPSGE